MLLRAPILLLLCLLPGACSLTPAAVTVGPATVVVRPPDNPVDRYFLDVHEAAHRAQFRRDGVLRMLGAYSFRPSLRLRYEAQAYATALCTADRLQADGALRRRLYEAYVDALRSYTPTRRPDSWQARHHLDGAYRGGEGCEALLELAGVQPPVPPRVRTLVRQRRPASARSAVLRLPPELAAVVQP